MRISVCLTVDLDREDWDIKNGTAGAPAADIRDDVRAHILNLAQQTYDLDASTVTLRSS